MWKVHLVYYAPKSYSLLCIDIIILILYEYDMSGVSMSALILYYTFIRTTIPHDNT